MSETSASSRNPPYAISLRLPRSLGDALKHEAGVQGVSVNRLCTSMLSLTIGDIVGKYMAVTGDGVGGSSRVNDGGDTEIYNATSTGLEQAPSAR
jgi:hypothetical protein